MGCQHSRWQLFPLCHKACSSLHFFTFFPFQFNKVFFFLKNFILLFQRQSFRGIDREWAVCLFIPQMAPIAKVRLGWNREPGTSFRFPIWVQETKHLYLLSLHSLMHYRGSELRVKQSDLNQMECWHCRRQLNRLSHSSGPLTKM